jgi:Zn-finger nucleic acid-binding protein
MTKYRIAPEKEVQNFKVLSSPYRVLEINGKYYARIPYGNEYGSHIPFHKRCHDCHVKVGGIHHFGCDMERCPVCRGQLIACGCSSKVKHLIRETVPAPAKPDEISANDLTYR